MTSRRDQRRLHPARAHRDAVGDRDRVELHRRAAGLADALLDLRGERAQVEVARHRLDPGRGDADDRLGERLGVEADAVQVGAGGRAVGPSVSWRERCLGSSAVMTGIGAARPGAAAAASARSARARRSRSHGRRRQRSRCDLARVDLAAGQVQVGLADQALLVALERHPLGEHVVGVGQPRRAERARLVRELDAVLVEQLAGLRQVGDDRLVRVDEVGVGDAAEVPAPSGPPPGRPTRAGSRGRGTSPTPRR